MEAANPMITISPQSVNATVGVNVTFTCAGINGIFVVWFINELVSSNVVNIDRGIRVHHEENKQDVLYSYLTVPATPSNNNVSIKCALFSLTNSDGPTAPATLLVQGKLEVVTDLDVLQLNSSFILVSFTPPLTLEGVPIRNYSIEILDNSNKSTAPLSLMYTVLQSNSVAIELTDPCLNYTCAVSAWNDIGQGSVETLAFVLHQAPDAPDNFTASVEFPNYVTSIKPILHVVLYSEFSLLCVGKVPDCITVYQLNETLQPSLTVFMESSISCDSCSYNGSDIVKVVVNISSYVSYGNHYLMAVKYSNKIGHSSISSKISISTFLVSDATVYVYQQQDNSSIVCLQCTFIPSSITPPPSCKAIFDDNNDVIPNKSMIVPYNKQFNVVCDMSFRPGRYTVYVFDSYYLDEPAIHSFIATVPPQYGPEGVNMSTPTSTYATSILSKTSGLSITTTITTTIMITIETTSLLSDPSNSVVPHAHSSTLNAVIMSLIGSLCVLIAIIMVLTILLGACKIYYKQQLIASIKKVQTHQCGESSSHSQGTATGHSTGPIYERVNNGGDTMNHTSFRNTGRHLIHTTAVRSTTTDDEVLEMTKCPAYVTPAVCHRTTLAGLDQ